MSLGQLGIGKLLTKGFVVMVPKIQNREQTL